MPDIFFIELEKKNFKFVWKTKTSNNKKKKKIWRKNGTRGISLPDFRLYYKTTVIKPAWYWHRNRHRDQWNQIENTEINLQTYGQLIYNKESKNIQWRIHCFFNKWFWENWTATCKRIY